MIKVDMDDYHYDYDDYCVECSSYGDDWYYDAESDSYVYACDDCPLNPLGSDEDD